MTGRPGALLVKIAFFLVALLIVVWSVGAVPVEGPLSRSSRIVICLVFIAAWNEFLFALACTTSIDRWTIPVGIMLFPAMYHVPWGNIAASTLVTLPLVVLVLNLQRWLVRGIVAGALKG